jgi:hypothetical protein
MPNGFRVNDLVTIVSDANSLNAAARLPATAKSTLPNEAAVSGN